MSEYVDRVLAYLHSVGATEIRIEHGGKHHRVVFSWKGQEMFHILAGSTGDTLRGFKKAISDLRHMLGLVAPTKRVGARRSRKRRAAVSKATALPVLAKAPPQNWHDDLTAHPILVARLPQRATAAWTAWWVEFTAQRGWESRLR